MGRDRGKGLSPKLSNHWKESFSHLSTNPDVDSAELLLIGQKTQMVCKVTRKQRLRFSFTLPGTPISQYLHSSFTRISNALNVLEVTEQNQMGHCIKYVVVGEGEGEP